MQIMSGACCVIPRTHVPFRMDDGGPSAAEMPLDEAIDAVVADVAEVCGIINAAEARLVALITRVVDEGLWAGQGILSPEHWSPGAAGCRRVGPGSSWPSPAAVTSSPCTPRCSM